MLVSTPQPRHEQLVAHRVTAAGAMQHVAQLAQSPRTAGSDEYRSAADYVVKQAREAGFDARVEPVEGRWGNTLYNVVADRKGKAPDGERKLVLAGAHLDSVWRSPGANDNASGSATLLETAKALAGIDTSNDVRLMWFDGEEQGLLGSAAYARSNAEDLKRAVVMLNADMVASPNGDVGMSVGRRTSIAVGQAIAGVAERNGIKAVLREERHGRSDHESFDRAGVPSVDFGVSVRTVGKDDPNYHSPRDTPDKLNGGVLESYADLFALSVLHFAEQGERLLEPRPPRPLIPPGEEPPL